MRPPILLARRPVHTRASTLAKHLQPQFPVSDQVLLCSFGGDLTGEQTTRQLRDALVAAGFRARTARHLIRVSPLLRRSTKGWYRLRPFER